MKCRIDISGRKTWNDDNNAHGKRPPSVEIRLLRDGEIYKTAIVDSAGDGRYKFPCLIVRKNSEADYVYTIDEAPVEGYTKKIQGFNITNQLDFIPVNGTKIWDDNHNAGGIRPGFITIALLRNGTQHGTQIFPGQTAGDTVPFTFASVPFADSEGRPYVYTAAEVATTGYNSAVDGLNITNTLITGGFSFNKTSTATGLSLQGAVFEIRQNGTLVSTSASDAAGKVTFEGLLPGEYRMAETVSPAGYMDNTDIYDVIVSNDGSVTVDGMPAEQFGVKNTPEPKILLRRATSVVPAYMAAPNTWPLHGTISPDLYMLDKIMITLPYPPVTVKWAYGVQDEEYFRTGGGIDITASYQDGFPVPLNTDYTVYVMFNDGTDAVETITVDRLRDGSEEMPYLLIDFSTADSLEPSVPGIDQFTLYYMQGIGIKLTQHYEIYENIDMEGKTWEPIGFIEPLEFFKGSLYGNGNDLTNLTIGTEPVADYYGLFRLVGDGASIQNMSIVNGSIETPYVAGGFAAYVYAQNGGSVLMKDLHFNGILKAALYCGGIAGGVVGINGSIIIEGCTTNGDIASNLIAGGIAGEYVAEENGSIAMTNCYSSGSLSAQKEAAGIVGGLTSNNSIDISNCLNAMTVNCPEVAGGIAGGLGGKGTALISSCYNKGDVTGSAAGGIAGSNYQQTSSDLKIINCYNSGTINASNGGGIFGYYDRIFIIQNCYNIGNVISSSYAGGISAGYGKIENCAAINELASGVYMAARITQTDPAQSLLSNNIAFDNMQVLINGVQKDPLDLGSAGTDGISVTAAGLKMQGIYEASLGWDFTSVWSFGNGAYTLPVLRGIPADMQPNVLPPHLV